MRASHKWIKELLPSLKATPEAIAKRLTNAGLEVEGLESQADALREVVVGEVRALRPHPDAERLQVAAIFDGAVEHTVVTGAPNVQVGQRVALARVGVELPGGIKITRKSLRGVESSGMVCSEAELGLSERGEKGIVVLKPRSRPGKSIVDVLDLHDVIFELSVTPNRPDVLSHFGLARELAALYGLTLPRAATRVREQSLPASAEAKVEVKDARRCPKYLGRVITGVKTGPSPSWVQRRLKAVGLRPISSVVDATNLVLMELGHPLHAFDLHKLRGRKIVVRTASEGEPITLLDSSQHRLTTDDLVIADAEGPVAIAGVMGGAWSEVTEGTVDVLLESAMFDARSVRRTSKRLGLHTDASHRFERGADPSMVEAAVDRCAQLIVDLAGGQVLRGRVGAVKAEAAPSVVAIRPARASRVLGRPVEKKEVRETLAALGLKPVKGPEPVRAAGPRKKVLKSRESGEALYFRVPSWRIDLSLEEDLIEEVARVGGYELVPTRMPPGSSEVWTEGPPFDPEREVRGALVSSGFLEAISLAFNSRADASAVGQDLLRAVVVTNPLGEESQLMRMSLLPALLHAVQLNQDNLPSLTDLRLFEVGRVFRWGAAKDRLPDQALMAALVMRGRRMPKTWASSGEMLDAYDLKALIERVLSDFRIEGAAFVSDEAPWLHPRSATRVEVRGETVGLFGEVHPAVLRRFRIEGPPVLAGELDLEGLARGAGGHAELEPLPKLPPAQRDLSFFIEREVTAAEVLSVIRGSEDTGTLESVEVFDMYEGQGVPNGKKSLAVAMIFRSSDRTLTDAEVEVAQGNIVRALEGRLGADIRSARPISEP